MVLKSKVILTVGAHPDDIELGCGGTIRVSSLLGNKVIAVFLTKGEKNANPDVRMSESRKALKLLGATEVHFGDFADTEIPNSHAAIDFLEKFFDLNKPETVLTHSVHDTHQDHRQVSWLSLSAFRNVEHLLAYETPRVTGEFNPNYFIDISSSVHYKWDALHCHQSQKDKRYIDYDSMVSLASFRGRQANLTAAEAFEVIRYVENGT